MALSDYISYPFPQDTSGTTSTINSNTSLDTMTGGSDNEYFQVTSGGIPSINGNGGDDFIEITSSDQDGSPDTISADAGNDTILITGGVDTDGSSSNIDGDAGQDYIGVDYATNGVGAADDDIFGGTGDDVIEVFNAASTGAVTDVRGEDGADIIVVESSSNINIEGGDDASDTITVTDSTGVVIKGGLSALEDDGSSEFSDTFQINGISDVYLDDWHWDNDADGFGNDDVLVIDGATIDLAQLFTDGTGTNVASAVNDGAEVTVTTTSGATIQIDSAQIACFMNGTSIATPAGEVAVETLAIGDMVTTADGSTAPVKWMGRREVSSVFAAKNASVQPILITQGALGNGLPTADLRVSPDHAMYVDGVLVHAEALVNGTSIVQEAIAETFTYYHIELENHDLVLANGAAAETFVDSDVRARFDNAAEYVELYGATESAASQATHMALPRVKSKRQLPAALKAKLA